jgi:hypothetical protein
VIPLLNYQHGHKIDLFLKRVCNTEYVVVSDDDVFWLDDVPWNWAMGQFEEDPNLVVVSLLPRNRLSSVLKGRLDQAMGSHCLILRSKTWAREALSFKVVYPLPDAGYDWFYDTGDYANIELLKRGYKIAIAPPEVQGHLVAFDGVSSWSLKIQERSGKIMENLVHTSLRQEKALRVILTLKGMASLIAKYCPHARWPEPVPEDLLIQAEDACCGLVTTQKIAEIRSDIEGQLNRIAERLESYMTSAQVAES